MDGSFKEHSSRLERLKSAAENCRQDGRCGLLEKFFSSLSLTASVNQVEEVLRSCLLSGKGRIMNRSILICEARD